MTVAPYDPLRALRVLADHEVDFVVIGGFAARLWGSPTVTNDLDVCPAWDRANLERLAAVLVELGARLRGAPDDVTFLLDAATLANGLNFTFSTDAGGLDVLAAPAGGFDYPTLRDAARSHGPWCRDCPDRRPRRSHRHEASRGTTQGPHRSRGARSRSRRAPTLTSDEAAGVARSQSRHRNPGGRPSRKAATASACSGVL